MAGPASFERGERYASTRRVKKLKFEDSVLSATVEGTQRYKVRMRADEGDLDYLCSCPIGQAETFCKHCVATGLVWLRQTAGTAGVSEVQPSEKATVDLRSYLATQQKEVLVDLILERAEGDELFEGKLALLAAKAASLLADLEPYRQAIEAAIVVHDFVDYRSMYDYATNVTTAIRALEELLDSGQASEVISLCEYALECVEDAIGRVDDSDGAMGEIKEELVELHHRACLVAPPDPEELAERLFDWGIHSEWEIFLDGAEQYADVLGEAGLARYRSLAEQVWALVPVRQDSDTDRSMSRFLITYIMEALAKISGSVDEEVAVRARDLSYAYHYVQIIELLVDTGRYDDALTWAERGLASFPDHTDVRLRDVAAHGLRRAGRDEEAMDVIWRQFEERPSHASYEFLHEHAMASGSWNDWRERALQVMHAIDDGERSARAKAGKGSRTSVPTLRVQSVFDSRPASSELVKVYLWEGDVEPAWAQAQAGGCSVQLWLQLAALREDDHPEDAIPIYEDKVEWEIGGKNNHSYQVAVDMMLKVGELMERTESGDQFSDYVTSLRASHKAKRNLMKLFDQHRW
jgi:uncharacterized Zn finger protein